MQPEPHGDCAPATRARPIVTANELRAIEPIARALGYKRSAEQIAHDLTQGTGIHDSDPEALLNSLSPPKLDRWRECAFASWALGLIPLSETGSEDAVQALTWVVGEPKGREIIGAGFRRSWIFSLIAGLVLGISFVAYDAVQAWLGLVPASSGPALMALSVLLGGIIMTVPIWLISSVVIVPISCTIDNSRVTLGRRMAIISLGRIGGRAATTELLALATKESVIPHYNVAQTALKNALPTLTDKDFGCIAPSAIKDLCHLLRCQDPGLQTAALDAMELVGDGSCVEPVERLATRFGAECDASVAARAQQVLPILRERRRKEVESRTLLRPSTSPGAPEETLLRPASDHGAPNEARLLRPAEGDA